MSHESRPNPPQSEIERQNTLEKLHEFVEALDRRVPHPEREAEGAIARDSATMRREAEERIEELQPTPARPKAP